MIIPEGWLKEKTDIISLLRIEWSIFIKGWIPFTQGCFVPCLVEIGPVVLEKNIFRFLYFVIISPLKKDLTLYLHKLDSLHSMMFVPSLVENGQWFWRKQIFKLRQSTMNVRNFITICIFHNICPEKRRSPSFQTQLNLFHPRVFLCQVWLKIGPVVLKKNL